MILKKLSVVAVIALGLATFGCKSDCEKICEDMMECDPEDQPLSVQQEDDCADDCEELEELIDAADCGDIYDELVTCIDGLDLCDYDELTDSCEDEYADYGECIADYCAHDPTDLDEVLDLPGECD
jgi:hypothetical protein